MVECVILAAALENCNSWEQKRSRLGQRCDATILCSVFCVLPADS